MKMRFSDLLNDSIYYLCISAKIFNFLLPKPILSLLSDTVLRATGW